MPRHATVGAPPTSTPRAPVLPFRRPDGRHAPSGGSPTPRQPQACRLAEAPNRAGARKTSASYPSTGTTWSARSGSWRKREFQTSSVHYGWISHAPAWALILYDNHKGRHHPATRPPRNNKPERVPMCLAQFRKRAKPRNQNGSCNVSSLRGPAARSVHACRHAAPIAATSGVETAPRCPLRKAPPLFDRGTALKRRHPRRGARGRKGSPKLAASLGQSGTLPPATQRT